MHAPHDNKCNRISYVLYTTDTSLDMLLRYAPEKA